MNVLHVLTICTALIAAINPVTLSVVMMSLSSILGSAKHPRHAGLHTIMFAIGTGLTIAAIGIVLQFFFDILPVSILGLLLVVLSLVIVGFGLLEIKDYFWYGKGLSFKLTKRSESYIHAWTKVHHGHWRGFLLGITTTLRLSHYTLIILAVVVGLNSLYQNGLFAVPIMWAVCYALPPLMISLLIMLGVNAHGLVNWKEQAKHTMRLSIGLVYAGIGLIALTALLGGIRLV